MSGTECVGRVSEARHDGDSSSAHHPRRHHPLGPSEGQAFQNHARAFGLRAVAGAVLLLAPVGAGAAPAAAEAQVPTAPLLAAVLERLETRGAFESPFRQINYWMAFDEADTARGLLTVAPPDRFCLDYHEPEGHLVLGDGRFVWTIVPEERQVLRASRAATSAWGEFFYRGMEAAVDSLAPVIADSTWGAVVPIRLEPRPEYGIDSLYVELTREGALPVGYGYVDQEGNRIRFRFAEPRFPDTLPPERFRFVRPEGYEIFEVD